MNASLDSAFDDFVAALGDAIGFLRQHPFYEDPENRASAHGFLASLLIARIEEQVISDPDFPFFRVIDPRSREGADNPEQRYLVSLVTGGATYRVWGNGPSLASTKRTTPSTIFRARSTSPPKSLWPGVSTMLIFTP